MFWICRQIPRSLVMAYYSAPGVGSWPRDHSRCQHKILEMNLVGIMGKHNMEMVHPSMDKYLVKRVSGEREEALEMRR